MKSNSLKSKRQAQRIYQNIDVSLTARGYLNEKVQGYFYRHWYSSSGLHFYVNHGTLGVNKLFIDAELVDLKETLSRLIGVLASDRGLTTNHKFELFKIKRERIDGIMEYEGWGFQFANANGCEKFLDVCEVFSKAGIDAAQNKAMEFDQISIPVTGKSVQVESRVGQSRFKKDLHKYWKTCAVTGLTVDRLLRASHIKPWAIASPIERLDPFNGLLLTPNLDALFDQGLITFNKDGQILISSILSENQFASLGLSKTMKLKKINGAHIIYLDYHYQHIFKQ